jgi:hypothetical protein
VPTDTLKPVTDVHFGRAQAILDHGQQVLRAAYLKKTGALCERSLHSDSGPHRRPDQSTQCAKRFGETITAVAVVESMEKGAVIVPSPYPRTSYRIGVLSSNPSIADLH